MRTVEEVKKNNRAAFQDIAQTIRMNLESKPPQSIDEVLEIVQNQAAAGKKSFGYSEFFERELTVRPIGFLDGDALSAYLKNLREQKNVSEKDKAFKLLGSLCTISGDFNKNIKQMTDVCDLDMTIQLGVLHSNFLITCIFVIEAFVMLKVIKAEDSFELICVMLENNLPPEMSLVTYKNKDRVENERAKKAEEQTDNLREMTDSERDEFIGAIDEVIECLEKQLEKFSADSPEKKLLN